MLFWKCDEHCARQNFRCIHNCAYLVLYFSVCALLLSSFYMPSSNPSLICTHNHTIAHANAGNTNTAVTAAIKQVADMYDVRPISGTLMHQMKQYVIDGKKMILLKELEPDQQKVKCSDLYTLYGVCVVQYVLCCVPLRSAALRLSACVVPVALRKQNTWCIITIAAFSALVVVIMFSPCSNLLLHIVHTLHCRWRTARLRPERCTPSTSPCPPATASPATWVSTVCSVLATNHYYCIRVQCMPLVCRCMYAPAVYAVR